MPHPALLIRLALLSVVLVGCSRTAEESQPAAAPVAAAEAAAPAPVVGASDQVHAFSIGTLNAFSLRDGDPSFPNDNKVFGVGLTPEAVAEVLSANGLPTDQLQLGLDPLLVKSADKVLLFDTGAGTNFGPGAGKLLASMGAAGVDPASVTDIFISHSHGDHIGGLATAEGKLNFPNATIHISKPEWDYLSAQKDQAALVAAVTPKVDAFAPGAELLPGVVKAVDIKGHTPGHSGYEITSGKESLLYIGDTLHHFVVSVQRPGWTIAFDGDARVGAASREALIQRAVSSGQRLYGVHFPFPGVGKLVQRGEHAFWVSE